MFTNHDKIHTRTWTLVHKISCFHSNKFEEQEKSIATKDEIIDKQNTLLRLMKQRTPETGDQIDREKFFKYKQQIMKYFKDINFF